MKRTWSNVLLFLIAVPSLLISCQPNEVKTEITETIIEESGEKIFNAEEEEIIAFIEKLLFVAGNNDLEAMDSMVSDKANLGIAVLRDGAWQNRVTTISEYFEAMKEKESRPYFEPVNEYEILINKGQIAFVWADATLHTYGVPRTNNIDNFTLIKEDGEWQILNASFTNTRLPEEMKKFDLDVFAKSYAQAWCGVRPDFVAMFFEENGALQLNESKPAKGRAEIAKVVNGFMEDLPDMVVSYDSLVKKAEGTEFHWTLTATASGPGGSGNKVEVSGYEFWQLGENNLILNSHGHFPTEEYNRQLGIEMDKK